MQAQCYNVCLLLLLMGVLPTHFHAQLYGKQANSRCMSNGVLTRIHLKMRGLRVSAKERTQLLGGCLRRVCCCC